MSKDESGRREAVGKAVAQHGLWVQHKGGRRADFSFQDLSGLRFDGADLSGAKFAGANLAKAWLRGTNLANADMFGADMEMSDLTSANLTGADLRGANMSRCVLTDAVMRGADFRAGELASPDGGATIGGVTSLTEAKMERSVLAGAYLSGCDLSGADLVDADLSGAELSETIMIGVDLSGANLQGATLRDTVGDLETLRRAMGGDLPPGALAAPTYRQMTAGEFSAAVAAHHEWTESNGTAGRRLDLDLVSVPATMIAGYSLVGARLRRCYFQGGDWRGVDLHMADLSYAALIGVDLTGASLQGANFRRSDLRSSKLIDAKCEPFLFNDGKRWPTNFDGVDLSAADTRGAVLTDAVLGRAAAQLERRRHTRYTAPAFQARIGDRAYNSVNWSLGGMCLQGGGFNLGDRLNGYLCLPRTTEPAARATFVVMRVEAENGRFVVGYDKPGADLKALFKRAFALSQETQGGGR
jgi:uncharacterized protein YjbI with pentapeptide repeats